MVDQENDVQSVAAHTVDEKQCKEQRSEFTIASAARNNAAVHMTRICRDCLTHEHERRFVAARQLTVQSVKRNRVIRVGKAIVERQQCETPDNTICELVRRVPSDNKRRVLKLLSAARASRSSALTGSGAPFASTSTTLLRTKVAFKPSQ